MRHLKYLIAVFGLTAISGLCFSQNPNWEVDLTEYQFRMSITSVLERFGDELVQGENKVAAYVGEELRGVGFPTSFHEPSGRHLAIFQIGSNRSSGEKITFRIYHDSSDQIVEARFTIGFNANDNIGSPNDPFTISDNQFPTNVIASQLSFNENLEIGSMPISFSTTDGDDSVHQYNILNTNPEILINFIAIEDNSMVIEQSISYESYSEFTVTIESSDELGGEVTNDFLIEINDLPETPQSTAISNSLLTENVPIGTLVGILSTQDDDDNEAFEYKLLTENELFLINGNELLTADHINYENGSEYQLQVETLDKDGLSLITSFTIFINDINEAPTAQSELVSISENIILDSIITQIEASDEDRNQILIYQLTDEDVLPFGINSSTGNIFIDGFINYEDTDEYTLQINISDDGTPQESVSIDVIVSIIDLNETPTSIHLSNYLIAENADIGTVVGSLTTTDEDLGELFTYELLPTENSLDYVNFELIDDQLIAAKVLDREKTSSYSISIKVTDSGENVLIQELSVFVIDQNEPPALSDTLFIVEESLVVGAEIGQVIVIDPDEDQELIYELVGNSIPFSIDNLGVLTLSEELNYETQSKYNFSLKVIDNGIPSISNIASISIQLVDVNEVPTDITISNNEVLENRMEGSYIGQLFTEDQDQAESFVYEIISVNGVSDQNQFEISNGRLFSTVGFNFELINAFNVIIKSIDKEGLWLEKKIVIEVKDINEPPTLGALIFYVDEDAGEGTEIGKIPFNDEDLNQNHEFSILNSPVDVQMSNGLLVVGSPDQFDYETISEFQIKVAIIDDGSPALMDSMEYTIRINDLPEENLPANNFISPNGDGINDYFIIQNIELYEGYVLEIYNASGVLIMRDTQYDNKWGGIYKGEVLPPGVYFYSFSNPIAGQKYEGQLYVKDR